MVMVESVVLRRIHRRGFTDAFITHRTVMFDGIGEYYVVM
jgi:hypothetical protein